MFIRALLLICIFLGGNSIFASTLSLVEIQSLNNNGKIILDTDNKYVTKKNISNNEIEIKLKDTNINENIKTINDNVSNNTQISIMQNGKDAYINLYGNNIAKYELNYASDNSLIPINNRHKDIQLLFSIALFLVGISILSNIHNSKKQRNKNVTKKYVRYSKDTKLVKEQQNQIKAINTLRAKNNIIPNNSIHGTPVANFVNSNKINVVDIPNDFKHSHNKYFEYEQYKKAVNS